MKTRNVDFCILEWPSSLNWKCRNENFERITPVMGRTSAGPLEWNRFRLVQLFGLVLSDAKGCSNHDSRDVCNNVCNITCRMSSAENTRKSTVLALDSAKGYSKHGREGTRMASSLTRNQVPRKGLRVRVPCPPRGGIGRNFARKTFGIVMPHGSVFTRQVI